MKDPILVTGATGAQGGATATALLAAGYPVRVITRDPGSAAAQALGSRGVEVMRGDFDESASLDAALAGVAGLFSMQLAPPRTDPEREVRTGLALLDAAHRAGVEVVVHTSVARAGEQAGFAGWREGRWWKGYWDSKSAVNDAVAGRGFPYHTILKPAFMMDNLLPPKVFGMFPALPQRGRIESALAPDTHLDLIAAQDIGAFAAAAFAEPARFHGHAIDLAAEAPTMDRVAAALTAGTGRDVTARSLSQADADASGINAGVVESQLWNNVEGYRVDLAKAASWGIALTSLESWVAQHRDAFVIGAPSR